jgi:hypothetical protein
MKIMSELNQPPTASQETQTNELEQLKQEALKKLMALGSTLPTATTLIDVKTNNVFAEPGV